MLHDISFEYKRALNKLLLSWKYPIKAFTEIKLYVIFQI